MARNLVMFDPADSNWCVVCRIGSIWDSPKCIISFYKTLDEANEAAASLREKINVTINIQIFEYTHVKDETGILNLLSLDGTDLVVKYLMG